MDALDQFKANQKVAWPNFAILESTTATAAPHLVRFAAAAGVSPPAQWGDPNIVRERLGASVRGAPQINADGSPAWQPLRGHQQDRTAAAADVEEPFTGSARAYAVFDCPVPGNTLAADESRQSIAKRRNRLQCASRRRPARSGG